VLVGRRKLLGEEPEYLVKRILKIRWRRFDPIHYSGSFAFYIVLVGNFFVKVGYLY